MQFKDYYDVLGVPVGADADVIKSAYRRLARKFHPDVSKETNAEERFKAINEAYEVLKDTQKRAAYDQLRARGYRSGEEFRPPPNWSQDFGGDGVDFDQNAGFSDFFESLFGRFRANNVNAGRQTRAQRDLRAKLDIDLEKVYTGGAQRVRVNNKTLEVIIPAGVQPGQQIRLAGQGEMGGDLLLEVQYRPHEHFTVEGRNITAPVFIAPWEAALGATISVRTLAGTVDMRVPAGSRSGRKLRLKERGVPGAPAGDHFVILEINTPPANTKTAHDFYEKMAKTFAEFNPRNWEK